MKIACEYCHRPNSQGGEMCKGCGAILPIITTDWYESLPAPSLHSGSYTTYMGKSLGIYSVHEIREMHGLPPLSPPYTIGEAGEELFMAPRPIKDLTRKSVGLQ